MLENLDVPTTPIRLAVFTDGNELDEYMKGSFEVAFNNYIFDLPNRKIFNVDKFLIFVQIPQRLNQLNSKSMQLLRFMKMKKIHDNLT